MMAIPSRTVRCKVGLPPDVHSRTVPANGERSRKVTKRSHPVALGFLYAQGLSDGGDTDPIAMDGALGMSGGFNVF